MLVKSVKASKTELSLKKGKTFKLSATRAKDESKKKLLGTDHGLSFQCFSTNEAVATVTNNGKIKAVGKGTCYVYVVAINGAKAKVKVVVK